MSSSSSYTRHEMNFFSSAQAIPSNLNIHITVTPSKSTYYAGDTFTATITLAQSSSTLSTPSPISAVRKAPLVTDRKHTFPTLPSRQRRIGTSALSIDSTLAQPYSPGANTLHRACPSLPSTVARQLGHGRRTQSLALGPVSPQEMVWALTSHPVPTRKPHTRSVSTSIAPPTTTVTWAYTRLSGTFHPSTAHIPPDPLLPLRSLLLHRPVGSGSFQVSTAKFQLSFGTGSIGLNTQPTLTGSLFGLAKGIVSGSTGSLEEERKRVWNMKDLPVLETSRHLLGVDIQLKSKDYTYSVKLPDTLPPTYKGKAYRFTYNLIISLAIGTDVRDVSVPVKIHPRPESLPYDILDPIMSLSDTLETSTPSLEMYCRRLLDADQPEEPNEMSPAQTVEILTRQSASAAFDIAQDGEPVCTITLVKSAFRLGESVIGVITFSKTVAKTCVYLETHEVIPSVLHPPSQPPRPITRIHADFVSAFTSQTSRIPFSLDVPSDATPGFVLGAGTGRPGGLEWRVRFSFLVTDTASLVLKGSDADNRCFTVGEEPSTSVVNCEVPIQVLAGNNAFVVKPSMHEV